jgi:hypothetical protein
MTNEELARQWRKEVYDRESEVDEDQSENWYSLALGYALGKGKSPNEAHAFARHVLNYESDLD